MTLATETSIRFFDYELDLVRSELRHAGIVVPLEPQVFDLLVFLAERPGRVLSRDQLIDGVWKGRIVSDSAIATRISAARQAIGDDGRRQAFIKTVSRRGFLFVPESEAAQAAVPRPPPPEPVGSQAPDEPLSRDNPRIVVLPFENLSGDPDQSYFSDGITDEIITDLSRYGELLVIARDTTFAFRGREETALDFARDLGVAYVLGGSIRRSSGRLRFLVQLTDVASREVLWAETYDREVRDILDVQAEIAAVIVNTLVGKVTYRYCQNTRTSNARTASAYDHLLKAQQLIWAFSPEDTARARSEAEAAIRLDPRSARAHAVLAWTLHIQGSNGWSDDPDRPFDSALAHAKAAIAADANEAWGHCVLGFVLFWRERDFRRALEEVRTAVRLNPSNAHFRLIVGATLAYLGDGEKALNEIDAAMLLNPLHPGVYLVHRARALFVSGRYEEALSDVSRAETTMPTHANVLALLSACHAILGHLQNAKDVARELHRTSPGFTLSHVRRTLPFANPADLELLCEQLELAGLPE